MARAFNVRVRHCEFKPGDLVLRKSYMLCLILVTNAHTNTMDHSLIGKPSLEVRTWTLGGISFGRIFVCHMQQITVLIRVEGLKVTPTKYSTRATNRRLLPLLHHISILYQSNQRHLPCTLRNSYSTSLYNYLTFASSESIQRCLHTSSLSPPGQSDVAYITFAPFKSIPHCLHHICPLRVNPALLTYIIFPSSRSIPRCLHHLCLLRVNPALLTSPLPPPSLCNLYLLRVNPALLTYSIFASSGSISRCLHNLYLLRVNPALLTYSIFASSGSIPRCLHHLCLLWVNPALLTSPLPPRVNPALLILPLPTGSIPRFLQTPRVNPVKPSQVPFHHTPPYFSFHIFGLR
ncbi:hypothetical protein CRG98_027013 [Punica granatum]|uniref:Uncharacterized protein n=1 Tax=Punica granatum TaxID=22663 RepID=A0A2I0J8L7_PUNGR|nr:hypothetical protein CRG98_027013 [Punica granatum]